MNNLVNWHISTWLLIWLSVFNIIDFELTVVALNMGVMEANPFLNFLMNETGTIWVILWFKAIILSFLILPYAFLSKYYKYYQTTNIIFALSIANVAYLVVIIYSIVSLIIIN